MSSITNPSHNPPHHIPLGCPSAMASSALFHASNLDWSSISHMIIYMFHCYSLKLSHPQLLPQSPKVCLFVCFFFLFIYFFVCMFFFLFYFFNLILFFKLYIIILVLPNIKMNPPQVYLCLLLACI